MPCPYARQSSTTDKCVGEKCSRPKNPRLGQKLLTYFVSLMAERLTFANRMIAVLRR